MPSCWVINAIVVEGGVNRAKVATLEDLGREPVEIVEVDVDGAGEPVPGTERTILVQPHYHATSLIYPERGMTWCLSYVSGADFAAIDADPDCERVFEELLLDQAGKPPAKAEHGAWLDKPPTGPTAKTAALLMEKGIDTRGLTPASKRNDWLVRVGRVASAGLDTFAPEAWYIA